MEGTIGMSRRASFVEDSVLELTRTLGTLIVAFRKRSRESREKSNSEFEQERIRPADSRARARQS